MNPRAPGGGGRPSATIEDYGRYGYKGRIFPVPNRAASGRVNNDREEEVTLAEQTDRIPCQVGETWGIRIRSSDVPTDWGYTVRREMYHPPIRQPDGSVMTKSLGEVRMRPGGPSVRFCGWHFLKGYEYELVPGEWTVVVFIDDVEVARKSFQIRK